MDEHSQAGDAGSSDEPPPSGSHEDPHDLNPEAEIAASLQSALRHLRENAEALNDLSTEDRIAAAEDLLHRAAELDEQLGSLSRKDD